MFDREPRVWVCICIGTNKRVLSDIDSSKVDCFLCESPDQISQIHTQLTRRKLHRSRVRPVQDLHNTSLPFQQQTTYSVWPLYYGLSLYWAHRFLPKPTACCEILAIKGFCKLSQLMTDSFLGTFDVLDFDIKWLDLGATKIRCRCRRNRSRA